MLHTKSNPSPGLSPDLLQPRVFAGGPKAITKSFKALCFLRATLPLLRYSHHISFCLWQHGLPTFIPLSASTKCDPSSGPPPPGRRQDCHLLSARTSLASIEQILQKPRFLCSRLHDNSLGSGHFDDISRPMCEVLSMFLLSAGCFLGFGNREKKRARPNG